MKNADLIAQAPGRINIIGEHTDYNEGYVLPAAIDKKTISWLKKNNTPSSVRLSAENLKERFEFDLFDFNPTQNGWANYLMGVVSELQKLGAQLAGFDCAFEGNVPIGGGMSSSASLECSLAIGLNELFSLGLNDWQLIKACQMAEHHFVGIKCGIMDQFASVMGKKDKVILLDCRSLEYKYFPFELENYQLLLLNTNAAHSLASSEYNHRRADCEEGVQLLQKKLPQIQSLRDVQIEHLDVYSDHLPERIFRRCKHILLENERVLSAGEALVQKDFHQLGKLMYQSHFSLKNDYEVSCPELDFLVDQTIDKACILGSRMMGGGFGGCTISIIEKKSTDSFVESIHQKYKEQFGLDLTPFTVSIENGAKIVR